MTNKDLTFFTSIFIVIFLFAGLLSFNLFANQSLQKSAIDAFKGLTSKNNVTPNITKCSDKEKIGLDSVSLPELVKLREYQNSCNSFTTDKVMYFTLIPSEGTYSDILKKDIQAFLQFKQVGVKPIMILEPYSTTGIMSWNSITAGNYDKLMDNYFLELQKFGVTSDDIAAFVPLPEPNVPSWGMENNKPTDFSKAFAKLSSKLKFYYPTTPVSLLFNSQSYDQSDINWENGEYTTFESYTTGLPKGSVDMLGIQGFPWASAANQRKRELFDPKEFLSPELSKVALKNLKIKNIWFNTGTFYTKYAKDDTKKISILPPVRKQILSEIVNVANNLANEGYVTSVNIFAENKSNTNEATDWSYSTSAQKTLMRDLSIELKSKDIGFSIADR